MLVALLVARLLLVLLSASHAAHAARAAVVAHAARDGLAPDVTALPVQAVVADSLSVLPPPSPSPSPPKSSPSSLHARSIHTLLAILHNASDAPLNSPPLVKEPPRAAQ